MAVDVIMPQMGESIFEGTITKWLKKPGDKIERDEPLFEISTDKVDAEIPAPTAGVLKEIKVGEGKTVPIKTVVAVIEAAGGAAASPAAPAASAPAPKEEPVHLPGPPPKAASPAPKPAPAQSAPVAASKPAPAAAVSGNGQKIRSSPLVRRLAKENNVDLSGLTGTGAGGRISKKDILGAISSGGTRPTAPAPSAGNSATACSRRRGSPRHSRKRRAARTDLLRPLRSPADVRDATEASPSTWCSRSTFLRMSIRWMKRT